MNDVRMVTIIEETRPGFTRARIVAVDDRIIVDEYEGPSCSVRWYCDNCGECFPVTAQFKGDCCPITICETCCRNAINGIRFSYANPKPDGAA